MVRMPARVPMLDRKLLRDLWAMKGQALAIAAVVAAGVAMFVMYLSNFESLQRTRAAYYETRALRRRLRVAEARAVERSEPRIAAIPGVAVVETRVVADVTLDVPGHGGAGDRPADLAARARPAAAQRRLPAARPLDRSDAPRRSARERGVRARRTASIPATASPRSSTAASAG